MLRSAVIIAVPEAAPIVDPWRERTCAAKPSAGVPPHVTLVFPFVPAAHIDAMLLGRLGELFVELGAFEFSLPRTGRFPTTLYLDPDPAEPFVALTDGLLARYPEYPPYEGEHETIVPHLTVAQGDALLLDRAAAEIAVALPVHATAREAVLLEEIEPEGGRWITRATFRLGPSS